MPHAGKNVLWAEPQNAYAVKTLFYHSAKYLGEASFSSKILSGHTHTHVGPIAITGLLKWSLKVDGRQKCHHNSVNDRAATCCVAANPSVSMFAFPKSSIVRDPAAAAAAAAASWHPGISRRRHAPAVEWTNAPARRYDVHVSRRPLAPCSANETILIITNVSSLPATATRQRASDATSSRSARGARRIQLRDI